MTIIRTAELAGSSWMTPGAITLGYSEGVDAADDQISLSREYHHGGDVHEDTYTVMRGGPGFSVFAKAVHHEIPIEHAARWWDEYRVDYTLLAYQAVMAVDQETELRGPNGAPVTSDQVRSLLSRGDPIEDRMQASALEFAVRDGQLSTGADGGLQVTTAGRATLFAIDNPSRLGEHNRVIAVTGPAQLKALSFAASAATTPTGPPPPAAPVAGRDSQAQTRRAGSQHGRH